MQKKWILFGGAGFVGSHFVDHLLESPDVGSVTVVDNFASGSRWHLADWAGNSRLRIIDRDVRDTEALYRECVGHHIAVHLASNPDIARAAKEPSVDFENGTILTQSVLEVCRRAQIPDFVYASGSGVYGDLGELLLREDHGLLKPTSTYGASKLAGEAMVSAYCHMFGLRGRAFRFANVVGRRQTHGVVYDFIHKLKHEPSTLSVLGDGYQSKPYIHVRDVVDGVMRGLGDGSQPYEVYNVAPPDHTNVREIANLVIDEMGLTGVEVTYGATRGGWKGDVPVVRLAADKLRGLGWRPSYSSSEAVRLAARSMLMDIMST